MERGVFLIGLELLYRPSCNLLCGISLSVWLAVCVCLPVCLFVCLAVSGSCLLVPEQLLNGYVHPRPLLCPIWMYDEIVVPCLASAPAARLGFEDICFVLDNATSSIVHDDLPIPQSTEQEEPTRMLSEDTVVINTTPLLNCGVGEDCNERVVINLTDSKVPDTDDDYTTSSLQTMANPPSLIGESLFVSTIDDKKKWIPLPSPPTYFPKKYQHPRYWKGSFNAKTLAHALDF